MRVEKLLNIMEKFLDALQYEHMSEAFEGKDPIDFMCDDSEEEKTEEKTEETKEENEEEEREEITRTVVDHTPKAKCEKLEKEKNHLDFLLDTMCNLYGCSKVVDNGEITILYDPEVIKEVHKVLKKKFK